METIKEFLSKYKKFIVVLFLFILTSFTFFITLLPPGETKDKVNEKITQIVSSPQNVPLLGGIIDKIIPPQNSLTSDRLTSSIATMNYSSSGRRSVGKFQSIVDNVITVMNPDGTTAKYSVDSNTQYISRVPERATPDADGFIPEKNITIAPQTLHKGSQIVISWKPVSNDKLAVFIVKL